MTNEIHINQWKQFFDEESRDKLNWLTKVEVLSLDNGVQILSEGLPLGGFTFEDKDKSPQIEILVGKDTAHHQTHNILAPTKVYFRRADENSGGTIEIEEADGTKTLVYLTAPANASVKEKDNAAEKIN
jgi:hypothetical protein